MDRALRAHLYEVCHVFEAENTRQQVCRHLERPDNQHQTWSWEIRLDPRRAAGASELRVRELPTAEALASTLLKHQAVHDQLKPILPVIASENSQVNLH